MLLLPNPHFKRAYHEAGHTIVARELGLAIERVQAYEEDSRLVTKDFTYSEPVDLFCIERFYRHAEKECICLTGGYVANCILLKDLAGQPNFNELTAEGVFKDHIGFHDFWPETYREFFAKFRASNTIVDVRSELYELSLTWKECVIEAQAILDEKNDELKKLACKLDKSKVLTGEQIDALLG